MSYNIDDYVLCDDDNSLGAAIDAIKLCSQVILDCEGKDLGQQGGSLSLISFRTIEPEIPKTYIIDVLSLTDNSLRPVFDIIQSSSPTKIVFDGRMDYAELFHGHDTPIRSVLDLQLADIHSRRLREEDEEDQQRRLSPYLKRGEINGNPMCYRQIQKLFGLEQCLQEHEVDSATQGQNLVNRQKTFLTRPLVTHGDFWLKRPLPKDYLRYSAWDVYFIGLLYNHFKNEGYITYPLSEQSERYVSIWQDARPKKTDKYRNHPLLPLRILDYTGYYPVRSCLCCQRGLPKDAYSTTAWNKAKQRRCWVCRAIYLKVQERSYGDMDEYDACQFETDSDGYCGSF